MLLGGQQNFFGNIQGIFCNVKLCWFVCWDVCSYFVLFLLYFTRNDLAVDGTFLGSLFGGVLLLAGQHDANNQLVLLCFAIVGVCFYFLP